VARIQINRDDNSKVIRASNKLDNILFIGNPIKMLLVIILMARILVYSAIKIRANNLLPYSTLKPDTSSDSPSAKSNGVRLVSARLVINHIKNSIGNMRIGHDI